MFHILSAKDEDLSHKHIREMKGCNSQNLRKKAEKNHVMSDCVERYNCIVIAMKRGKRFVFLSNYLQVIVFFKNNI